MRLDELARREGARVREDAHASHVTAADVVGAAARRRRSRAAVAGTAVAALTLWAVPRLQPAQRVELIPGSTAETPAAATPDARRDVGVCAPPLDARREPAKAVPGWTRLEDAPIRGAESSSSAAVDGDRLLVVPGSGGGGAAVFDADASAWTCAPPPRLSGHAVTASSGGSVYAWDGRNLERFDAAAAEWVSLPDVPEGREEPLAALWAGDRLLVWWESPKGEPTSGAVWLEHDQRWEVLPPAPVVLNAATAVWNGRQAYLVGSWLGDGNHPATEQAQAAVYDVAAKRWRDLPPTGLSPQASSAGWVGGRLVAWDYLLAARVLKADLSGWSKLPRVPLRDGECYPSTAVVGQRLVAWYCGQAAIWDSTRLRWIAVRTPPVGAVIGAPETVGHVVMIVALDTSNYDATAWRFDPDAAEPAE